MFHNAMFFYGLCLPWKDKVLECPRYLLFRSIFGYILLCDCGWTLNGIFATFWQFVCLISCMSLFRRKFVINPHAKLIVLAIQWVMERVMIPLVGHLLQVQHC